MEHLEYLFAAYSIIFILIGLYVIFIGRHRRGWSARSTASKPRCAPPSKSRHERTSTNPVFNASHRLSRA